MPNYVPIHVCLDWLSHSIRMEAFTPTRYKTVKIHRIEHTPETFYLRMETFYSSHWWVDMIALYYY